MTQTRRGSTSLRPATGGQSRRTKHPSALAAPFYDRIIDQLVARRKQIGMSQVDVNAHLECAEGLVGKWECRSYYPSSHYLMLWAMTLGCTLEVKPYE